MQQFSQYGNLTYFWITRLCGIQQGNESGGWRDCCCGGIAISLFDLITKQLNVKYDLYLVEDNKFGGKNETGGWNGMIGELINNKADIAINGFNPTRERLKEELHFTSAYQHDYLSFVKRKSSFEEIDFVNWEFVRTMETDLALWILFSTVFSAAFIVFSENIGYLMRSKEYFSTREVMTYIFGLTFQRDMGGRNPLRWGGRVVALSYAAAMTVVMTTYTAHLTAKNIQVVPKNSFLGLKDPRVRYTYQDTLYNSFQSGRKEESKPIFLNKLQSKNRFHQSFLNYS